MLSGFASLCLRLGMRQWVLSGRRGMDSGGAMEAPGLRGWNKLEGVQFTTRTLLALRGEEQRPAHRVAMCAVIKDYDRECVGPQ